MAFKGHISWNKNHNHSSYQKWLDKLIYRNKYNNPMRRKMLKSSRNLTSELSYIFGVLKGDGSLIRDNNSSWRLTLHVKDLEFAQKFKMIGEKWSGLKTKIKVCPKDKDKFKNSQFYQPNDMYSVSFYSKDLGFLKRIKLKQILNSNKIIQKSFIEGFSDSEGNIAVNDKNWLFHIDLYNKNLKLLRFCKKILENFAIYGAIYTKNNNYGKDKISRLSIYRKNDVIKFYKNFTFSIPRKQERIEEKMRYWSGDKIAFNHTINTDIHFVSK